MKRIITSMVGTCLLLGCGRREGSEPVALQKPSADQKTSLIKPHRSNVVEGTPAPGDQMRAGTDEEASQQALAIQAEQLIAQKDGKGAYSEETLNEMLKLAPELKAGNAFWGIVLSVPKHQRDRFEKVMLESLRALEPLVINQPESDRLRFAYSVALNSFSTPEIAKIAWGHFKLAPQYHFPPKPVEAPPIFSGSGGDGSHLEHGLQGVLAKAVLRAADERLRSEYQKTIQSADPATQRVLTWALGFYGSFSDFDMLMAMKDNVKDHESRGTHIRALNRMMYSSFPGEYCPPDVATVGDRYFEMMRERNSKTIQRRRQLESESLLISLEELGKFYD